MKNSKKQEALWKERLRCCLTSGVTMKEWCHSNNIAYETCKYWKAKLKSSLNQQISVDIERKNFVEVEASSTNENSGMDVLIGNATVRLYKGFDPDSLKILFSCIGV